MTSLLAVSGTTEGHQERLRALGCYKHDRGFWVAPDRETLRRANILCMPRPKPRSDIGYWMKQWRTASRYAWKAKDITSPGLAQISGYGPR